MVGGSLRVLRLLPLLKLDVMILLKVALNTKNQIIHGMGTIVSSKGNNSNKKNSKAYNFRIKTETGKLSIEK
jgi:hypothetical protein